MRSSITSGHCFPTTCFLIRMLRAAAAPKPDGGATGAFGVVADSANAADRIEPSLSTARSPGAASKSSTSSSVSLAVAASMATSTSTKSESAGTTLTRTPGNSDTGSRFVSGTVTRRGTPLASSSGGSTSTVHAAATVGCAAELGNGVPDGRRDTGVAAGCGVRGVTLPWLGSVSNSVTRSFTSCESRPRTPRSLWSYPTTVSSADTSGGESSVAVTKPTSRLLAKRPLAPLNPRMTTLASVTPSRRTTRRRSPFFSSSYGVTSNPRSSTYAARKRSSAATRAGLTSFTTSDVPGRNVERPPDGDTVVPSSGRHTSRAPCVWLREGRPSFTMGACAGLCGTSTTMFPTMVASASDAPQMRTRTVRDPEGGGLTAQVKHSERTSAVSVSVVSFAKIK
mmetsp:Transcript_8274/g.25818  ORF Transcript_8274/g.25818 Transcript_8274/m.25818 type:complete len:396 (-) Transcript_8274:705-1892(-)